MTFSRFAGHMAMHIDALCMYFGVDMAIEYSVLHSQSLSFISLLVKPSAIPTKRVHSFDRLGGELANYKSFTCDGLSDISFQQFDGM